MAHSNGIITAPINVETDIYAVLGIGPTSMGYDIGNVVTNAPNKINMWSKIKPVIYDSVPSELNDDQRRSVAYGLSYVPSAGNDYGIFSYTAPKTGNWLRSLDFNGYNHNAVTGLKLKTYNLSKDLFNDKTALVISLDDDINRITCYDLRDTLLAGWQLACVIRGSGIASKYWYSYISVNKRSLSWTVPYIDLTTKLGAGEYSIALSLYKNGTSRGFFPNGYHRGKLTLTSNTGISMPYWTNQLKVRDNGKDYPISNYFAGSGSRIYNLTNQNFFFPSFVIENKNNITIGNSNIFVQFRWPGTNVEYYSYVPLRKGDSLADWSHNHGDSGSFGCISSQIPKMTNASEGNILVTTNIVYKHTDGYYYNITDYIMLRLKKDNGPAPSSTPT